MDSKEVIFHQCQICNKTYINKLTADDCCKPYHCEECGVETKRYWLKCPDCIEKKRFANAEKIQEVDYDSWVWDENTYEYFRDIEALVDHYDDEELELPDYVYACEERKFNIDAGNIICNALEDMYDEADEKDLIDVKEFYDFVDNWVKKQTMCCYETNYKKIILLSQDTILWKCK